MSKLTDIQRNSEEFRLFARHVLDGINSGILVLGKPDDMYDYEDIIKSIASDAVEELLDRIYEVEDRYVEGRD